jgi:hypothetical protein
MPTHSVSKHNQEIDKNGYRVSLGIWLNRRNDFSGKTDMGTIRV